jgi:hypothetical protein
MSAAEWIQLQNDLLTFTPILFWWLVGLAVCGIGLAVFVNVLHATRGMMDRFKI